MRQYRIISAINRRGEEYFEVQTKGWFGTWYATYPSSGYGREYFYRQKDAETYLHRCVCSDEFELQLKKKIKEFKPKVVYGPYP